MNYMTPDLIARTRSDDDDIAEGAAAEWRHRCEAYRVRVKEIKPHLPLGLRRLLRGYSLHDAKVLTMAAGKSPHFSIFFELDNPSGPEDQHLELRYRLAGGVGKGLEFVQHEALVGDGNPFGWCMYDEIDLQEGPVEAFTHSLLFTGGCELRLTFFVLLCRPLHFLVPPSNSGGGVDVIEAFRNEK